MTEKVLEFEDSVPCLDDVGGFRVSVQLTCKVQNAANVVRRGVHDVKRVVVPPLLETLRRACGSFPAEDADAAEKAALEAVRAREDTKQHDPDFAITAIHLVVRLDDAAAAYVRERKEALRDAVRQRDAAALATEKARLESERESLLEALDQERLLVQQTRQGLEAQLADQRQKFELEREAIRSRHEHEILSELEIKKLDFEVLRQQRQAALDRERLQLDIERAEMEARYERMKLTARLERERVEVEQVALLLNQGEFERLALQLSRNPDDIEKVNLHLAQQHNIDNQRQFEALRLLIANDGLEGWQVTDQAKSVLTKLLDSWSRLDRQVAAPADADAITSGQTLEGQAVEPPPADSVSGVDDGEFPRDRVDSPASRSAGPESTAG